MNKDYYNILGVDKYSTQDEIKKAYRKLALKYHPDKNNNDEECKIKFHSIAEAYNVLNSDDKKKKYDMFGNIDDNDFHFDEDPFKMFNSIFEEHLNQFKDMNYENSFDIGGIINKLSGFNMESVFNIPIPSVNVKVKSYNNNNNRENINNIFTNLTSKLDNNNSSSIGNIFNNLTGKLDKNEEKINNILNNLSINSVINPELESESNLIKEVIDDIVIHLDVSISDIYNNKTRKITYEKNKYKKGELVKKKVNLEIDLYDKEIILKGNGNETLNKKGDVCIYIHCDKNDYIRINDYDIFYEKKINFKDFYLNKTIEIILPNDEKLYLKDVKGNYFIKINKKGIKYNENDETYYGNLYCYFSINMPEVDILYDIVNEIMELEDECNIKDQEYMNYSYVTSYDIFNSD